MSGPGNMGLLPFSTLPAPPLPQTAPSQEEPSFHPNMHGKWSRFCTCSLGGVSPDLQLETWSPEGTAACLGLHSRAWAEARSKRPVWITGCEGLRMLQAPPLKYLQVQVPKVSHPTCFPMVVLSPEGPTQRHLYLGRVGLAKDGAGQPLHPQIPWGCQLRGWGLMPALGDPGGILCSSWGGKPEPPGPSSSSTQWHQACLFCTSDSI